MIVTVLLRDDRVVVPRLLTIYRISEARRLGKRFELKAIRYGNHAPVTVLLQCHGIHTSFSIDDRNAALSSSFVNELLRGRDL